MARALTAALVGIILYCLAVVMAKAAEAAPRVAAPPAWAGLLRVNVADLDYARALAEAAKSPAGDARAACWAAWMVVAAKGQGAQAGVRGLNLVAPVASLASQFEVQAQVAEALHPHSPFARACTPVAEAAGMRLHGFVNAVAGGKPPRR